MNLSKKINITAFLFSSSTMLVSIAAMVANILIIAWVEPAQLGIWNTIIVLKTYVLLMNLGVSNGLNRELPFALGRNNRRLAKKMAETALFISLLTSILSFVTLVFVSLFVVEQELQLSLFILAIITALNFINIYYSTTFRTNQAFLLLSKINIVLFFVELITISLPLKYGYDGFLIRIFSIDAIKMALFLVFQPFPVKPKFTKKIFCYLLKTGIPLFISAYLSGVAETFKRVILKSVSSFEVVGLFSPALAIYTVNNLLPRILGQFIFPKLNYGLGQGATVEELWKKNMVFSLANMAMMLPVIVIGWFVIPHMVQWFFPKYTSGIYPAQIALLSGIFVPFAMLMNLFHSLKTWKIIYSLIGAKLILCFSLQYYFATNFEPLTGIAYGVLASDAIYAILISTLGYNYIKRKRLYEA